MSDRARRIARLEALSKVLDGWVRLPGTDIRVGLDGLVGLIPIAGDLLTGALSCWIVLEAHALGAPPRLLLQMLWNIAVDVLGGLVPVVGDAFDFAWRSNSRNLRLLRAHLDATGNET